MVKMLSGKTNKKRIIYSFIILLIIFFAVGVLISYFYINSENFRTKAKYILTKQLENMLEKKIEIGSIDNISLQSLKLTHLVIMEKNYDGEEILFQAEEATANFFFFFPFFTGSKEWQLNIKEITFSYASIDLTRDINGEFDLVKKINLNQEFLQENIIIQQINFQNSFLVYQDKLVYHYNQDSLITKVKDINGYFNITHLPKVEFSFRGIQVPDEAALSLAGFFFINKAEYALNFHLQNADITHFQYYLEAAHQFDISQGKMDLVLNLSFSPDWKTNEIFWQGKANLHQVSTNPYFLKRIPFQQINGEVIFTKPEIKVLSLNGLYHNSVFQIEGQVLTEPEIYFDLNIVGKQVTASLLKEDIYLFIEGYDDFALQGKVDLSGNINGLLDGFYLKGIIDASELIIENISFPNISGNFSLSNEGLIINNLESQDDLASIAIIGQLNWSEEISFYHFDIQTFNLPLRHSLFQQFSFLEKFSGNLESHFQIDSKKQEPSLFDFKGDFTINNMNIGDFSLPEPLQGNIKSTISLSDKLLSIERCQLQSNKSYGSLVGELHFGELVNFSINFEGLIPDLARYSNSLEPLEKIAGSMDLKGKAEGSLQRPKINIKLQLSEFAIEDNQIGELTGTITYHNGNFYIESASLSNQELQLTGEGKIMNIQSDKPEFSLAYQLHPLAIKPLLERVDYSLPLLGQLEGSGSIMGIWPELEIRGTLQLEKLSYQDYQLGEGIIIFYLQPEQMPPSESTKKDLDNFLNRIVTNHSLTLEHLKLQNKIMQLNAKGQVTIGEKQNFSLEAELSHQAFKEMMEHFYPGEEIMQRFLPSQINGKLSCTGNSQEKQILLSFQLIPQEQENNPPTKLEAIFSADKNGLNITSFQLIQSEGLLKAEGKITSDQSLDISFQASQLDISTLMSLIQVDEEIKGIMDIKGWCTGTVKQPNISITAQIKKGFFREFHFENLQSALTWNSLTNLLEIKDLTIALEKEYQITAQGSIPIDSFISLKPKDLDLSTTYREIPIDFRIYMEKANLKLLQLFWKDSFSEIRGTMDLELTFTGTADKPVVNGTIDIHQGMLFFNDLPVQIGEINDILIIKNNIVTLPSIPVLAYENRFLLTGELELAHFLPDKMSLIIKNGDNKITYQDILESEVDLKLIISNSLFSPYISGQVLLSNGVLHMNNLLQIEEGINFSFFSPTFQNNFSAQLEINIQLIDPFKLKMSNAEIDLGGNISLTGSTLDPVPRGTLTLKRGYIMYFDKRFTILDGLVTINGINPNNIDLNARAQTTVQGVQINIKAIGNLSNPQILLSSQPVLKETEILSLLTFDRNIQGLSEGEISQLLSQEMVNIFFQSLQVNHFRRLEQEIAEGLGLEFIRISFDAQENTGSYFFLGDLHMADLTLEIGKNIGDDLFITYSTPLDFHGEAKLGLDYKLSSDFTFSTQWETYSFKKEDYKIKFGLEIRF